MKTKHTELKKKFEEKFYFGVICMHCLGDCPEEPCRCDEDKARKDEGKKLWSFIHSAVEEARKSERIEIYREALSGLPNKMSNTKLKEFEEYLKIGNAVRKGYDEVLRQEWEKKIGGRKKEAHSHPFGRHEGEFCFYCAAIDDILKLLK